MTKVGINFQFFLIAIASLFFSTSYFVNDISAITDAGVNDPSNEIQASTQQPHQIWLKNYGTCWKNEN